MPQSHRDHGVAEQRHWLLDEELRSSSNGRVARPAVLERSDDPPPRPRRLRPSLEPPRRNLVLLAAGLVTALLVYALLRAPPSWRPRGGPRRRARGLDSRHRDLRRPPPASLPSSVRSWLGRPRRESDPARVGLPSRLQKPKGAQSPNVPPDDGVLPPLPPPPAPPPIIPEIPPEIPAVEIPPLPALEVPEVPRLPELPELPLRYEAGDGTRTRDPQLGRLTL